VIRLLIADDHPIVLEGLKRIVADCDDIELVAAATTGEEVARICRTTRIDVLVLDISMPGPGFLSTMKHVLGSSPDTKILLLSVHPEEQYAVRGLRAGASGYLTKDRSPDELANAIRRIHSGKQYITETVAEELTLAIREPGSKPPHEQLTDREFEVLRMLGAGHSVSQIAAILSLSPKTVSTYRARIMTKLRLKSGAELIRYAVTHDLAQLP
jgi:DNA-binding NarL/FixJ family response regulator